MALTATFRADFESYEASLQRAVVQTQGFDRATKNAMSGLRKEVETFKGENLAVQAAKMVEAVKRIGGVSNLTDAELKKLKGTLDEVAQKAQRMGDAVPPEIAKMREEVTKLAVSTEDLGVRMERAGRDMQTVGRTFTAALTLPILAVGGAAVKMSTDFNAAMANVGSLIPGNVARVNELKKSVQDMAIATGKSTGDLAAGLYQVISAFGDTADTAQVLDTNSRAAAAGLATTTDAINLTSAVTKGYGDVSAEAVKKAADLAFVTVKLGQTTFPELASAIGQVVPVAAKMNVAQEELFAGFATLTGVTGSANQVSTQFAAILRAMLKPTEGMAAAVKQLGFAGSEAMVQQLGLVDSLRALIGTTDGSIEAVGKLFGRAESLTAVFALTGGQADVFDEKLRQLSQSAGAMDEAFREQTDGVNKAGFAWAQFTQKMAVAAQRLGDDLAPHLMRAVEAMKPLLDGVLKLASSFGSLPQFAQIAVIGLAAILVPLGPLLYMSGQLLISWGALKKVFAEGAIGAVALEKAMIGLKGATALLITPLGAIGLAVGGLAITWASFKDDWVRAFDVLIPPLGFLRSGLDKVKEALEPHQQMFSDLATILQNSVIIAFETLKDLLQPLVDLARDLGDMIRDRVVKELGVLANIVERVVPGTSLLVASFVLIREHSEKMAATVRQVVVGSFVELVNIIDRIMPGLAMLVTGFLYVANRGVDVKKAIGELAATSQRVADAMRGTALQVRSLAGEFTGFSGGMKDSTVEVQSALAASVDYVKVLADMKARVAQLTPAQREQLDAAIAAGVAQDQLTLAFGLSAQELKLYQSGVKSTTTDMKAAGAQQLQWAKEQQRFQEEMKKSEQSLLGFIEKANLKVLTTPEESVGIAERWTKPIVDSILLANKLESDGRRDLLKLTQAGELQKLQAKLDYAKRAGASAKDLAILERNLLTTQRDFAVSSARAEFMAKASGLNLQTRNLALSFRPPISYSSS